VKTVFPIYVDAILANLCEIWRGDAESYEDTGHLTKAAIFENQDGGRPLF